MDRLFFIKALLVVGAAFTSLNSCGMNPIDSGVQRQAEVDTAARKVIFDKKSSHKAIAEGVFTVFCARNKCRDRSDYDLKTDLAFDLIVEFNKRSGIDMEQRDFDNFTCFVSSTAVYCVGFEQPILLREAP
jgi:hypothetical protein